MRNIGFVLLVLTILTYWDGAGDTPGMEYYRQGGAFLRFTELPVRVYLDRGTDATWQNALEHALQEINPVVPIAQTQQASQADILVEVLPRIRFDYRTPCYRLAHADACSQMYPIGQPNSARFHLYSRIWIRKDALLAPQHLVLHELLHALGLLVHSPYPEDVMYNGGVGSAPTALSPRDQATLARLYSEPAVGE